MLTQLPFTLENSLGWPIRGDVRWSGSAPTGESGVTPRPSTAGGPDANAGGGVYPITERPVVVICHGFKGFKDWGMFPWVAERLAEGGFRVVTFNFGGSGIDDIPDEFTRLDRFRRNTLSLEVEELEIVLAALDRGNLPGGRAPTGRVGILGHSRGTIAASVVAGRKSGLGALVLWAGIGALDLRYPEDVRRAWREAGELDIRNARTGQRMPLGPEALEDLERHLDDYSPLRILPALGIPTLWIHGARDATIPMEEVRVVDAAVARPDWRFVVLDEADHTFGGVHPFRGTPASLEKALATTRRFLEGALGES
jgi:pimeloyl-ACP methyl ester carboxylesterase